MIGVPQSITQEMLAGAVNDVMTENPKATDNIEGFLQKVSKKFIEKKLDEFPKMCDVFRYMNFQQAKELRDAGNEKGWSEKKEFKLDYTIPTELYNFMVNLVYRDFWNEENERVWRPFLRALMRGDDAKSTLMKVKMIYGTTADAKKAGIL